MRAIYQDSDLFSAFVVGTHSVRRDVCIHEAKRWRREGQLGACRLSVESARRWNRELVAELRRLSARRAA